MDRLLIKRIATLTIPAVITNITTPLLAITDVTIMGHIGDASFLAAIAVGATMFNMLYWLFGFLRMGASGLTAQAYGASDHSETYATLTRGILLAFAIGMIFIVVRQPLSNILLMIMDSDECTRTMASDYFNICIWGAPAMLGSFAMTGWLIGMQNTRIPMWVAIFTDVFNIALSLVLVFGLGMGMHGVATGTLMAQWGGFLLAVAHAIRKYGFQTMRIGDIMDIDKLKRFFRINSDIFLRTLCLVAITMWFTRTGAQQGTVMLAVNALLMQLFTLFSFFMDGTAFAGEALCGRYTGAGDNSMLRRTVKYLLAAGAGLAMLFTLIYILFGMEFMKLLSSDLTVINLSRNFIQWAILIPAASFGAFIWDGIFIGLTRTRAMLGSMAWATAVFFAIYAAAFPSLANHGLWIAFLSYLLTRGVALTLLGRKYISN